MNENGLEQSLQILRERSAEILSGLFSPTPLVHAGAAFDINADLRAKFDDAVSLYRNGRFTEALQLFLDVEQAAEATRSGAGRTARLNAAACAIRVGQNDRVVGLLESLYNAGHLYGLPLWNLSLAYYRLNNDEEALRALEKWLLRSPEGFRGKGLLIAATLSDVKGDDVGARQYLTQAVQQDERLVARLVALDIERSCKVAPTLAVSITPESRLQADPQGTIHSAIRQQLIKIVKPKRPERSPVLSGFLTREEMESFARAIELMAEGYYQHAFPLIAQLRDNHSDVILLDVAVAACELSLGNNEKARDILLRAETSGVRLSGAALWNLACAQIRLGDDAGALMALNSCAETEYRTKSELWVAIEAIGKDSAAKRPIRSVDVSVPIAPAAKSLVDSLPASFEECRKELLRRLLIPKKVPRNYRPDLARLPERERVVVARVLDATRRTTPPEALSMLLPLVRQHFDNYTLRVHAATYALLSGDLAGAFDLLRQAQSGRPLDPYSRINLACICMRQGKIADAAQVLEEGVSSSLAEKYTFWLALAMVRATSGRGDASIAAAHALALVGRGPSEPIVSSALRASGIKAGSFTPTLQDPTIAAAREALSRLDEDNIAGVVKCLAPSTGPALAHIPEIGPGIFEPEFIAVPYRRWNREVVKKFTAAVQKYNEGNYGHAAAEFSRLYKSFAQPGIAMNMLAAYLKAEEPRRVQPLARQAMSRYGRKESWGWRLGYNRALVHHKLNEIATAVQIAQKHISGKSRQTALVIALCAAETKGVALRETMGSALDKLRLSVNPPSNELMLALAWAKLTQRIPDVQGARVAINHVAQRTQSEPLKPPAEVISMKEVRTAFDHLQLAGKMSEADSYLATVIETRIRERQSAIGDKLSPKQLERSVGVELVARGCLAKAFISQGKRERAIQELDEGETLLNEHAESLPVGFLAKDWLELSKVAYSIGVPWAAIRHCEQGLKADPEHTGLKDLHKTLQNECSKKLESELVVVARKLILILDDKTKPSVDLALQLRTSFLGSSALRQVAPLLSSAMETLVESVSRGKEEGMDIEEQCDRANALARMELPAEVAHAFENILNWIIRHWGSEEAQIPVEVDAYDGKIWPRSDEREGCCLLGLTAREDTSDLSIYDDVSESLLWKGSIAAGKTQYIRWTVERDDGFVPDDLLDLPLLLKTGKAQFQTTIRTAVSVSVGSGNPRWPTYPTGALSPDDVAGNELYGRADLIRRITGSLGGTRCQAAYFLEAPRQMGKTSLLNFVKREVPQHVLPVYVNLELPWAPQDQSNPWNYLVERVLTEVGDNVSSNIVGQQPRDLVQIVARVCDRLGKKYIFLLLDDFHSLIERCGDPRSVLAVFREFHNNTSNRISLLLADRYTREELEAKCGHEYWAQLSVLTLGPLDRQATGKAIVTPTEESDVVFLTETIDRLYEVTGGYPYHVQRTTQYMLDSMWGGPWLTALPYDVDDAAPRILAEDGLFQIGLCRPDRIDSTLEEAIAALLEWRDLLEFLPNLRTDSEWAETLRQWQPRPGDLLAGLGDSESLLRRLVAVGVMKEARNGYAFFSPLLEQWLKSMRNKGRSLLSDQQGKTWAVVSAGDGANLSGPEWQQLDNELIQRCRQARKKPPLKERATTPGDWQTLVKEVASQEDFRSFLGALFRLWIDDREDKLTMPGYPWLALAYHRARLVRNYFEHRATQPSQIAIDVWDQVCTRAIGQQCKAYQPALSHEWRAIQVVLLRTMFAGMRNAIALVGSTS